MCDKRDASRSIFYFDLKCLVNFENDYLKNRITDIQKVEASSKLAEATCFGMHRKDQMLYFGVNDKLYYYDLVNKKELELSLIHIWFRLRPSALPEAVKSGLTVKAEYV